jgi:hypothetical protein
MAITTAQTQVTWSSASSVTVSSATEVTSDLFTLDQTTIGAGIALSVDNAGTPSSGDTAIFRLQWTMGDILGDTGNDYDTSEHAPFLQMLDTYGTSTPGEDPARTTIPIDIPFGAIGFKVAVTCANAATRNMVVRARVGEQRAA